ncbi:OmpH family outer membrane protein [Pelagibaculum spongiae]|uniref:OmpH family outer membrane protein n=1 Tax=Pelagibaculum spongiae TaxID=2080658 RepID=A0A2V1H5D5_9GAMM|nr:OmpH family outer membrane protein [Pelagibaculum spongiae]PVZ72468.1 hypothetical protein DC094_05545 [Pelagibaculum spongiae]
MINRVSKLTVTVCSFLLLITSVANANEGDVVYFNFDQFYEHSKIIKDVQTKISDQLKQARMSLMEKNEKIEQLREELTNSNDYSSSGLKKRRKKLEQLQDSLSKESSKFKNNARILIQDSRSQINLAVEKIIKAVAKQERYSLVINASPEGDVKQRLTPAKKVVLFTDGQHDITPLVADVFDQQSSVSQFIK